MISDWDVKALEDAEMSLTSASVYLRAMGRYGIARMLTGYRKDLTAELLRRNSELVTEKARQLSIIPPGAYDRP